MVQEFARLQFVAPRKSCFELLKIPDCGFFLSGTDPQGPAHPDIVPVTPIGKGRYWSGSEVRSLGQFSPWVPPVSWLVPRAGAGDTVFAPLEAIRQASSC